MGPILFNLFINNLLKNLNSSQLGSTIGDIHVFALGFADDIVLVTDCPSKAQKLLNLCQSWASFNRMAFNSSKCKVMVLNGTRKDINFEISSHELQIIDNYKYLAVTFSSNHIKY